MPIAKSPSSRSGELLGNASWNDHLRRLFNALTNRLRLFGWCFLLPAIGSWRSPEVEAAIAMSRLYRRANGVGASRNARLVGLQNSISP